MAIELKNIKISFPDKIKLSPKLQEQADKNLLVKKAKSYGFFDDKGKWKEK